jgi:hypothetical protein
MPTSRSQVLGWVVFGLAPSLSGRVSWAQEPHAPVVRAVSAAEARFPEPFSLIRGVRELEDGRVLVTDWIEERVLALDFERGTATEIGRVGSGPTEFRLPAGLIAVQGDSTLLEDLGNARFAVIGPDMRIHRTFGSHPREASYGISARAADRQGRLYFVIPGWAAGPQAVAYDSVDVARWDPVTGQVESLARIRAVDRPQGPSMSPRVPFVVFGEQDGWALATDGRMALVRSSGYRIEWLDVAGRVVRGPVTETARIPVTDRDREESVRKFVLASPMSGKGGDGGLGHTPAEWTTPAAVSRMVRASSFAEFRPPFEASGIWVMENGELWVQRSLPKESMPTFDVFDGRGVRQKQVTLPLGRVLVGVGRGVVYAVIADQMELQTLERYRRP